MATSADPNATSEAGYHRFTNESGDKYGSFYVFFVYSHEIAPESDDADLPYAPCITQPGWYWRAEFPGCMPDGDPMGPFNTSGAAFTDANDSES